MITRDELTRIAKEKGFTLQAMEKDYALTWALQAIYSNESLSKYLVFKGGTCLSKAYAREYRLSEDLDFSTYKEGKLDSDGLKAELRKAFEAANRLGAPSLELLEKEEHENPGMITHQIRYIGPLGHPARIKLELTLNEKVIYAAEHLQLKEKTYSDTGTFRVRCYALIELLVEKVRAMMQRGKSRDYYDVWQIMTRKDLRQQAPHDLFHMRRLLVEKCDINKIDYEPELIFDAGRLEEAEKHWKESLDRLVKDLPEFDTILSELRDILWDESELANFNQSCLSKHLRNITRRGNNSQLLRRGIKLLALKLSSRSVDDVTGALSCAKDCSEIPKIADSEAFKDVLNKIAELEEDKDPKIAEMAARFRKRAV
jgi:predicted nucleotidyltransferase component of viral defense system